MAPMFETRFLRLLHLFEVFENCSIRLNNDWNNFYETNDHLQQFKADKLSSFFKNQGFTFSLATLIEFIQLWPETLQHIGRLSRPFCLLHLIDNLFSAFPLAAFLSFTFFFRFWIMCCRVFNKTIILLRLAGYEMIITNSALRASLVIYHFLVKSN